MLESLAVSLLLTLLLEDLLALLWGVKDKRDWLLVLLVNLVTNPVVVTLHHLFGGGVPLTAVLELSAVLAEALAYRKWGRGTRPAFLFSLCANCFSYFGGLALSVLYTNLIGGI
jgi:O-antigen/teichoic acid export membrane protein